MSVPSQKNLFDFTDYKAYLEQAIAQAPGAGRGLKKAFAEAARCQTSYMTHVLSGPGHFNLDQAEAISRYLGHSRPELRYFLLLVELARAATPSLKQVLSEQIEEAREKQLLIKDRIRVKDTLSRDDQATYYSAWYYSAIHVILSIPELQTKEAIARYLQLPSQEVSTVLDFLMSTGLATQDENRFKIGRSHIHLEKDSPLISKHHTNWRVRCLRALEQNKQSDLHYSSVVTLSEADARRVREILVKTADQIIQLVKDSKEEKVAAIIMDFFDLH